MILNNQNWYKDLITIKYPWINKFFDNFNNYRSFFNVAESLYLTFYSMKRHHTKIIREVISEMSHDKYSISYMNIFDIVKHLYFPLPIKRYFSGLEHIDGHKLSDGDYLEICWTRAAIAEMAGKLRICTATRNDLIRDQKLGIMLRINIRNRKEIIANICVKVGSHLAEQNKHNPQFYILGKNHKSFDNTNLDTFNEIKNHLNKYLKIYDFNINIL